MQDSVTASDATRNRHTNERLQQASMATMSTAVLGVHIQMFYVVDRDEQ
jgi:hypothetical protein